MGVEERRRREREWRRGAILDAAERIMDRSSPDDATMDDVAAEAEVSKGTLYLYFSSKDALFTALMERRVGQMKQALEAEIATSATGLEALGGVLRIYRDHFSRTQCRFALLSMSERGNGGALEARLRELTAVLEGAISQGQQDGSVRDDLEPEPTALQLLVSLLGVSLLNREVIALRMGDRAPVLDQVMPTHLKVILQGLAGPAAGAPPGGLR